MDKPVDQFSLLKSHIDAYTKKDGTTVKAHETRIEAHGVKGMKSNPWRKEFKSHKHLDDWMTKQDGNAELHGVREMEQSAPAAAPTSSVDVRGEERYEFTHGKKPGGKGGSYIFSPHKTHDFGAHGNKAGEDYFQSEHGSGYTDAKGAAKKWAAGKGHGTIYVQT